MGRGEGLSTNTTVAVVVAKQWLVDVHLRLEWLGWCSLFPSDRKKRLCVCVCVDTSNFLPSFFSLQ
jgi:hypothetical protein